MLKQNICLPLESLVQPNYLNLDFVLINYSGFDKYLFHLITLLKTDCNCSNNFSLSCCDKVTTGTYNFVSVIANVAF